MGVVTRHLEALIRRPPEVKPAAVAAPAAAAKPRAKTTAETIIEMEAESKKGGGFTFDVGDPLGAPTTPGELIRQAKEVLGDNSLDDVVKGVLGDDWKSFRRVGVAVDSDGLHIRGADNSITTSVTYNPKTKVVTHNLTTIPRAQQGAGKMRPILRSRLDTYAKIGVEKVKLIAGLDTGPYAWLRYGFVPDYPQELANTVVTDLTRSARNAMGKEDDWDVIEELADLDGLAKELEGNKFVNQLLIEHAKNNMPKTARLLKVKPGDSVLKGHYLNTTWEGSLDLSDQDQMAIFREYTR